MKKERIKSIILILLVITNLVLAEKILVNEKLWLSGYNFFVSTRNSKRKDIVSATKSLTLPENIIVNTGYQSSRFIYRRNSELFNEIYESAIKILKSAFSSEQKAVSEVSVDDWHSVLTSKSIYLNYSCNYNSSVFSSLLGNSKTDLSSFDFSNIVINDLGNVYFESGNKYYRIQTNSNDILPIIQNVTLENQNEESVINYSFDLNFDNGSQMTILSPMILIYSEPISSHAITSKNPVSLENEIYDKAVSNILTAFSINKNSARRYTEADGSLVYVENNGILKISPTGILTFNANENGIKLKGNGTDTSKLANFIDTINSALNIDSDLSLVALTIDGTKQEYSFDYMIDGYPIKYTDGNAITEALENGYLTSYSQVLRRYSVEDEVIDSPDYIEALDEVISKYQSSMSEIHINKMFPAFLDDISVGTKILNWQIDVDNNIAN